MWCVALILPHFWGKMESLFVVPISFAILSLNTPICILLSCSPDLDQAIRLLPDQKKAFCMPYCLFIFFCNMTSNTIFLYSWQMKNSNVGVVLPCPGLENWERPMASPAKICRSGNYAVRRRRSYGSPGTNTRTAAFIGIGSCIIHSITINRLAERFGRRVTLSQKP